MKSIFLYLFVFACTAANAQKFYTSAGSVAFTSETPVETIVSANSQVTSMINTETKAIAFKVLMKSFHFERQGMYEHFNHKYLETDKFPNATFEGKITDAIDLSKNGTYTVVVDGRLTIHGVTKPVKQKGTIMVESGKITVASVFTLLLSDFDVKVPSDYIKRISNAVKVSVNAVLTPYTR
jgi:polyisoprenoid-binding protein YceI